MALKIEDKIPLRSNGYKRSEHWQEFLAVVPKLKVGQSVFVPVQGSNYRLAATIAQVWLGMRLAINPEGKGIRVGRVA